MSTLHPEDIPRLKTLAQRVAAFVSDEQWHSLAAIRAACGGSESGISARLREFRLPKFGGLIVEHKRVAGGLWLYRVTKPLKQGKLF